MKSVKTDPWSTQMLRGQAEEESPEKLPLEGWPWGLEEILVNGISEAQFFKKTGEGVCGNVSVTLWKVRPEKWWRREIGKLDKNHFGRMTGIDRRLSEMALERIGLKKRRWRQLFEDL